MQFFKIWICVCLSLFSVCASAALPAGTWKFERSVDYFGRTPLNQAPKFITIVVRNNEVHLSDKCIVRASPEDYFFSDVFQPLTKQGITEKQVNSFLVKHFNLSLSTTKIMYTLGASTNCLPPMMEFFVVNDKILVPEGVTFYLYARVQTDVVASAAPTAATVLGGAN
jgi:hypothetical protein